MILYILNIERTLNNMEQIISSIIVIVILVVLFVYLVMWLRKRNNIRSLWEFKIVNSDELKVIERDDVFYYDGIQCKVRDICSEFFTDEYIVVYITLRDKLTHTATLSKLNENKCDIFICNK